MVAKLALLLRQLLALLMAGLVFAVTWQVLSRYLFSTPSVWTEELARFLLVWIGLLGGSYAYHERLHLAVDLLPRKLSVPWARRVRILNHMIVLLFSLIVMIFGGCRLVAITWHLNQLSPALGIPMALVYFSVPLSGGLITIFAFDRLMGERDQPEFDHD